METPLCFDSHPYHSIEINIPFSICFHIKRFFNSHKVRNTTMNMLTSMRCNASHCNRWRKENPFENSPPPTNFYSEIAFSNDTTQKQRH